MPLTRAATSTRFPSISLQLGLRQVSRDTSFAPHHRWHSSATDATKRTDGSCSSATEHTSAVRTDLVTGIVRRVQCDQLSQQTAIA
jgi:hypothetical protein